jgi:hypothetical protein
MEVVQMQQFTKTLKEAGFDGIFTEVGHAESLGLRNPHQLRMFHLDVADNRFSFDALHNFLLKNIGRYVFSRAKMEQFFLEDELEIVGAKAIGLLRRSCNMNASWVGEQLGDVILYVFLEQILGAPKLFNKIELAQFGNHNTQNGGGVHLLPLENGGIPSYQMVFGKSNIIGDLQDAIDNAFDSLIAVRDNASSELRVVESTVFAQAYDPETTEFLKSIIIPSKKKNAVVDRAFGVFLGYSLGLDPKNYSSPEFRHELTQKMEKDIKAHAAYIAQKIIAADLSTHSFYFYILPFNDADGEKLSIMNSLLEGGV